MNDSLEPFVPSPLFRGGIVQTIAGSKLTGNQHLPDRIHHKVRLEAHNGMILLEVPAKNPKRPLVLMAHGMGGCSESGYMRRIANKLWVEGFGVIMMNHRGSGLGMGYSDRLWNGGSSDDLESVVNYLTRLYPDQALLLVGFSLSGNILLKYLGEGRKIPQQVHGAFAVNPPIDLKVSAELISHGKMARVFNKYYMDLINRQSQALLECFPDAFMPRTDLRTIREFDEIYTAPAGGYKDTQDYYETCSARQYLSNVRVPTSILCAKDDPFIPPSVFQNIAMSLSIHYFAPEQGGHMGYLSKNKTPLGDHRWMDYTVVEWVKATL